MDHDAEALPHGGRHGCRRSRRIVRALLLHEVQNLVGALVRPLGSARPRKQPGEPAGGKGGLGGIEGLTAHAKHRGHLGDRPSVHPMPAQHLVLHLHPIAPIEELMARERLVLHRRGARVQRPGRPERSDLRVLWSC